LKNRPKVLAIVPARGGSKGVPGKNLRELGGQPLIQYAFDTAKESALLTHIVVSTDDQGIAAFAIQCGVEVIMRPKELASDTASVVDAVIHVLDQLTEDYDGVVLLQPTSPLRTGGALDSVIQLLFADSHTEGVVSVVPMFDQHPARMYNIDNKGVIHPFLENGETTRRQDLEPVYYRNGCFYAVRTAILKAQQTLMPKNKKAFVMDPYWLLNIDEPRDLLVGEAMMQEWKNQ
jgi:CMP-N,N'-diacetyllegionaminic acid synthase